MAEQCDKPATRPQPHLHPLEESALQKEFQMHLAKVADIIATTGYLEPHTAPVATRQALADVGIDIPPSDSKFIKDIPKTTEIPRDSKLQPGDIVIVGATPNAKHGDSFIVTPDGKAAGWQKKYIPDLTSLHEVHIYRPNAT